MSKKKTASVIAFAIVVKLLIWGIVFSFVYREIACVSEYVSTQGVVYVPESIPVKFYYDPVGVFFGNDVFEYWRIKPDKKEKEKLLDDIKNPQWSKIEGLGEYSMVFDRLSCWYDNLFSKSAKTSPFEDNSSYICLYDDCQNKIVCDDYEAYLCPNLYVYIYDSDDNFYYCIHNTV